MNQSGVNEQVIVSQLQTRGVQRRLEVSDIISLHQQGVSDRLISAMQSAPLATQLGAAAASNQTIIRSQPPVIIQEHPIIYGGPPVIYQRYRSYPVYHQEIYIGRGF
jgi:hypothetical protein